MLNKKYLKINIKMKLNKQNMLKSFSFDIKDKH